MGAINFNCFKQKIDVPSGQSGIEKTESQALLTLPLAATQFGALDDHTGSQQVSYVCKYISI